MSSNYLDNLVNNCLREISYKFKKEPNLAQENKFKNLAVEFNFQICEIWRCDEFASGIVSFKSTLDAYVFLRMCHRFPEFNFTSSFYKAIKDEIPVEILTHVNLDNLNEECIRKIVSYLNFLDIADLVKVNPGLLNIVKSEFRTLNINSSNSDKIGGISNFTYILSMVGHAIENIIISIDAFPEIGKIGSNTTFKYAIIHAIVHHTGKNFRSVTFRKFHIDTIIRPRFEPLFKILRERNVKIHLQESDIEKNMNDLSLHDLLFENQSLF